MGENFFRTTTGGQHLNMGVDRAEAAQDVFLHAIIKHHNLKIRCCQRTCTLWPAPAGFVKDIALNAAHVFCQIKTFQSAPRSCLRRQGTHIKYAIRIMCHHPMGHAYVTNARRQSARVNASQSYNVAGREPAIKVLCTAPI